MKQRIVKCIWPMATLALAVSMVVFGPLTDTAGAKADSQANSHKRTCAEPSKDQYQCNSRILTDAKSGKPRAGGGVTVNGLRPEDIHFAYNLPALPNAGSKFAWNGQTVAIVDAFDNPKAADDLLVYRRKFNLPLCATTKTNPTANDLVGCLFTKVNQLGQTSPLPFGHTGWGVEIDLDIQAVSATCPNCKILLVEADTNDFYDMAAAVDRAATMGANVISNSYGAIESSYAQGFNSHYNHPGVAIAVSSGDRGYGVEFPASSQYVTSVGGTTLRRSEKAARGWVETAWSYAGSGCSALSPKPVWQPVAGNCYKRMVADVSAVADPNTGMAVYDSFGFEADERWIRVGGTSLAAPIVAGVYGLAKNAGGTAPAIRYGEYPYAHTSGLNDVYAGSNGICQNLPLCQARSGWDGPTGLGTPNGLSAF